MQAENTVYFVVWWVLFEYISFSFNHFSNFHCYSFDTHPSNPIGLAGGITALRLASNASILSFTS